MATSSVTFKVLEIPPVAKEFWDSLRAEFDFINDGGDPNEIAELEEYFGVVDE